MKTDTKELVDFLKEAMDAGEIPHERIDCPECFHIEDEQYTCTTCWGRSGMSIEEAMKKLIKALEE